MKKRFILLLCALLLTGCARGTSTSQTEESGTQGETLEADEQDLSESYTCDQFYWRHNNIAACEEGYFLCPYREQIDLITVDQYGNEVPTVNGFKVYFYDTEVELLVPWCDRADCTHGNIYCDAFFAKDEYLQRVYYYDGKVYMISKDDQYYYLESFDKDGSNHRREGVLTQLEGYEQGVEFHLHDGYVYYYKAYNSQTPGFYRRSLSKMEQEECLAAFEQDQFVQGDSFNIIGEVIYCCIRSIRGGDENPYVEYAFYSMHTDGTNMKLLYETTDQIENTAVTEEGDWYYYKAGQGLMCLRNGEQEEQLLYSEDTCGQRNISYDGTYLYVDNFYAVETYEVAEPEEREEMPQDSSGYVLVFNKDGSLYKRIETVLKSGSSSTLCTYQSGSHRMFYGDSRRLFATIDGELIVLDKTQLSQDEIFWSRCPGLVDETFDYTKDAIFEVSGNPTQDVPAESGTSEELEKQLLSNEEYGERYKQVTAYTPTDDDSIKQVLERMRETGEGEVLENSIQLLEDSAYFLYRYSGSDSAELLQMDLDTGDISRVADAIAGESAAFTFLDNQTVAYFIPGVGIEMKALDGSSADIYFMTSSFWESGQPGQVFFDGICCYLWTDNFFYAVDDNGLVNFLDMTIYEKEDDPFVSFTVAADTFYFQTANGGTWAFDKKLWLVEDTVQ